MSQPARDKAYLDALGRSSRGTVAYEGVLGAFLLSRIVRRISDGQDAWNVIDALSVHAESGAVDDTATLLLRVITHDSRLMEGYLSESLLRAAMLYARWLREEGQIRASYALLRDLVARWPNGHAPWLHLECTYRAMVLELRGAGDPFDGRRLATLLDRYAEEANVDGGHFLALQIATEYEVRVGNLPEAGKLAEELLGEATRLGGVHHFQVAHLHAAVVAGRGGEPTRAANEAAKAILAGGSLRTLAMRDAANILGDALLDLGYFHAARRCFEAVEETSTDGLQRVIALMGLVSTSARAGTWEDFVAARARLEAMDVLVVVRVDAQISIARGLHRFGRDVEALQLLEQTKALAEQYNLHQDWFAIDREMAQVAAHQSEERTLNGPLESAVSRLDASRRNTAMATT